MNQTTQLFEQEISSGERYRFGRNWASFLRLLNEERIAAAEDSLRSMLGVEHLDGTTFLDIGSGSGLFSLAARRLGARVTSFDFDPESVECAELLRRRFFPGDDLWKIVHGSALDRNFMESLPRHDVVYSWGVLHHTGHMDDAIRAAEDRVALGGLLFIALYRKTWFCPLWLVEKRLYVASPPWVQRAMCKAFDVSIGGVYRLTHGGNRMTRGMDHETNIHDWLGGLPYESITPGI